MKKDALTGAPWLLAVARVFERAGEAVYLVGGAVRNPLMGLPLSDVDMCARRGQSGLWRCARVRRCGQCCARRTSAPWNCM